MDLFKCILYRGETELYRSVFPNRTLAEQYGHYWEKLNKENHYDVRPYIEQPHKNLTGGNYEHVS